MPYLKFIPAFLLTGFLSLFLLSEVSQAGQNEKFEKSENEEIASLVPKETYEILKFNEESGSRKDKKELLFQLFKYKFLTV